MTTMRILTMTTAPADIEAPAYDISADLLDVNGLGADHLADCLREAYSDGVDAARSAATWTTDGNGDSKAYARILRMLQDGDPEADDCLPAMPNLAGEWADGPTPASLADVEVRPHVARMTGTPWQIVELEGIQVGPFYDDHENASQAAADITDALANAWEAGRDSVWSQCVEAALIQALPDLAEEAATMLDYWEANADPSDVLAQAIGETDAGNRSNIERALLAQAIHLEALRRSGVIVSGVDMSRGVGYVTVRADARALTDWAHGRATGTAWPCSTLAADPVDGLTVELDGRNGDLIDLELAGVAYANTDGLYYPNGEGIGHGLELEASELDAFLYYALADVLPIDHPAWWTNVGRHLDASDPRRELAEHMANAARAASGHPTLYTAAELRATAADYARYAETARAAGNTSAADQYANTAERMRTQADAQSHL